MHSRPRARGGRGPRTRREPAGGGGGEARGEGANGATGNLPDDEGRAPPLTEPQAEGTVAAGLPGHVRVQADEPRIAQEVEILELTDELRREPGGAEALAGIRVVEADVTHATRTERCGLRLPA